MAGRNKASRTEPTGASDEQVRVLLDRYQCPVAFHEVRTRFPGNIAAPSMTASPIKMIQDLWGGELPAFDSIDAANELIGALIMGLWNRLTRHRIEIYLFVLTASRLRPRVKRWQTCRGCECRRSMVLSTVCSGASIGSICQSAPIVLLMISLKCERSLERCRTWQPTRLRLRRWAMFRRHFDICAR